MTDETAVLRPSPVLMSNPGGNPPTVEGQRRRGSGARPDEPRRRADAPRRERPTGDGGGSPRPPAGGSGGPRRPPGGLGGLIMIAIAIIAALFGLPLSGLLDGGQGNNQGGSSAPPPTAVAPAAQPTRVATAAPQALASPAAGARKQWLIMLYQNADDEVLERDIYVDVNEAEKIGSTAEMHIVAQIDRFRGGYAGDGDWTSTHRYYVTQDNDLERLGSPMIADIGEANMADGQTLVDFVQWATTNYPAEKVVLILSDHGMGWPGGWSDPTAPKTTLRNVPLSQVLGDKLYLMEMDEALAKARQAAGIDKFELVGMDACLMGHIEVFSMLSQHARYSVASQEVEPALGWAYTSFLQTLQRNPNVTGAELGRAIVQSYITADQRILDPVARAAFLRQGSPLGGLFDLLGGGSSASLSAEQLAGQLGQNITLTVVDLSQMPSLIDSLNTFAFALQEESQQTIAKARSYAQSFTNVFGQNTPPSYIDLGHFVQLLGRESRRPNTANAGQEVLAALQGVVLAEKSGPQKPGATGVSIYFPNSQLYGNPATGPQSYTTVANQFAQVSLWDEFLAFHYANRRFEAAAPTSADSPWSSTAAVVPSRSDALRAPGAGQISVGSIALSAEAVNIRETVTLSSEITGDNIGYIYLFVGYYDREANAIFLADQDYIDSSETRELNGIYYPVWPDGSFTLTFDWEPLLYSVSDGVESITVRLTPERYGATAEEAVYSVDGQYTFAAGGDTRHARLYFGNDGYLRRVYAFTGADGVGAPWEITPEPGDSVVILDQWLDLDANGRVASRSTQVGGRLTFGAQPFFWEELDAAAGPYIVGFIVSDLDGNQQQAYTNVVVR